MFRTKIDAILAIFIFSISTQTFSHVSPEHTIMLTHRAFSTFNVLDVSIIIVSLLVFIALIVKYTNK